MPSLRSILSGAATIGGAGFAGYGADKAQMVARVLAEEKAKRDAENDRIRNLVAMKGVDPTNRGLIAGAEASARVPAAVEEAKQLSPIKVGEAVETARGVAPIHTQQAIATAQGVAPVEQATHAANRTFDNAHQPDAFTTTTIGGDPNVPGSGEVVTVNTKTGERGSTIGAAKPTGVITATQRGQREDRLQQNFQQEPAVKQAGLLANAVAQLRASAAQKTPQGDLNMLYGAVKLRDPNAVREGELALNNKARSLHTQLFSLFDRVKEGRILTDQEREQILNLVDQTVEEQSKLIAPVQARFGRMAREVGADSAYVAPDPFGAVRKQNNRPPGFRP